jgi:hypothetical protein
MKRLIVIGAVLGALVAPGVAEANTGAYVPCWNSYGGKWSLKLKVKPRTCAFNGDEAHAWQTPIANMRWRSWGGRTACGRGVFVYNMGYRARVRFCLYRRLDWADGYVYDRIRGRFGTRWCALDINGKRICGRRKPSRFNNSTS